MRHRMLGVAIACAIATLSAQASAQLWVIDAPNRVVEYDVATFRPRSTITVPSYVTKHPEYLKINAAGQLLFAVPVGVGLGDAPDASGRIWLWDGARARELPAQDRDAFLTTDGRALVWFANMFLKETNRDGPVG